MLRIKKVLNSSGVLVTDEHDQEFILLGKGIGYGKKPGAVIMDGDFNQVFVASPDPNVEQLLATIASSSPQLIEITQTIVSEATEQLQSKLSDTLYVALLDHLKFALERAAKGIVITNRVYWEIKTYYSHEFEIGQLAVRLVNRAFKTDFSEQEAANIAAHIINAENGTDERKDALRAGQLIGRIINIIKYQAGGIVNEHDLNYQRCVVHVKFLVERAIAGELLDDADPAMVAIVKSQNSRAFAIAGKVAAYMSMKFKMPLPDEEVMLMAMQIQRLLP
ncbi:PRD domain-containing protein [Lactiplantibacillus plantarum]|uniref:PRD domain-containing protein n=1 Tax=Lactiplantibacillus plantarum TaxID=1590 RepID=UPI001F4CD59D|nr:PRD domain-containing protein [Lactiplantibacillus plantarum]MCH8623672.1 PRD domain-containing protein [Lactiplantibacillus plantarum]MCH8629977.1 PRD domain-containing protein [Lactiplantibacillus plantarum]MCH8633046.1 PRD domain-containing protein [Lactiplantibacillus plantarum]